MDLDKLFRKEHKFNSQLQIQLQGSSFATGQISEYILPNSLGKSTISYIYDQLKNKSDPLSATIKNIFTDAARVPQKIKLRNQTVAGLVGAGMSLGFSSQAPRIRNSLNI